MHIEVGGWKYIVARPEKDRDLALYRQIATSPTRIYVEWVAGDETHRLLGGVGKPFIRPNDVVCYVADPDYFEPIRVAARECQEHLATLKRQYDKKVADAEIALHRTVNLLSAGFKIDDKGSKKRIK